MTVAITRQSVWDAAFNVLDGLSVDAHDFATRIADRFAEESIVRRPHGRVPEETREAIKRDLIRGYWTYAQMRERHGVGTSTVQRIAQELQRQGITVHTVGSRRTGRDFSRCRHAAEN
jgi:UDP-N-acetylmuramyl pentapeptide synthase